MDPFEFNALPPLSPTMERAFSEALADISDITASEDASVVKLESPCKTLWPDGDVNASSRSPGASHNYHKSEIRSMSPCGGKKQALKDSADAKRARRSAIEKKSRQRRQNVLRRMREEVKQLELHYDDMVRRGETEIRWIKTENLVKSIPECCGGSAMDELEQKYSELSLVAKALKKDQESLQTLVNKHENFQKTIMTLSSTDYENNVWNTGVPPSSSFHAQFKQLSMSRCYEIVRESYEHIQSFDNSVHYETTGANFMGWTDKRKYDSKTGALQYGFTKKFPFESTEELLKKTWEVFADGPKFKHMSFTQSVNIRYEVLQYVNDDMLIVRRDHRLPTIETTFVTIEVLFRLQTPMGYTLCMRTIPVPEIQNVQDVHEYFYEVFHWTHFNRLYDEYNKEAGCEIIAAGSIADHKVKSTYWLFELVCSILRWEAACVAPLFLKHI